ncbi:MAG: succinyl-diaminopimelate desuccinylase [Rhodocyclaceae bacterium]|nr:succinyl-diaminopimelate desuccinylase [Rhodocyclaceae bacterium]
MAEDPILNLACELIARRSVTPDDAGCIDLIAKRIGPLGFACERLDAGGVANLWARRGTARPLVCLAGHADVVPPGAAGQWASDPFQPTVRNGMLVGRGAADMKSSLAAFVVAVERFVAARPDHGGSIALLLTSDEEGDATNGTVRVVGALKARNEAIDHCIVGEPTSVERLGDTIKNGRRGSLSGRLVVRGIQGHVAYPEMVRNPIHLAAPALAELAATRCWDEGNEYFPPTSFQVSNIHGGTGAVNVVPDTLEVLFNFRFSPSSTVEGLQSRVRDILDKYTQMSGLEYTIDWTIGGRPFLTPHGQLVGVLSGAIRSVTGIAPALSTSGGTSDGRFIADICPEVVEFGPINATIHKANECIAIADLEPLTRIYQEAMERLLAP